MSKQASKEPKGVPTITEFSMDGDPVLNNSVSISQPPAYWFVGFKVTESGSSVFALQYNISGGTNHNVMTTFPLPDPVTLTLDLDDISANGTYSLNITALSDDGPGTGSITLNVTGFE